MEFRLIVEAPESSQRPKIHQDGRSWHLTDPLDTDSPDQVIPPYRCISYARGSSRVPNPFYDGELMSTRTLPVLDAAIRDRTTRAFWIDAFCIPVERVA